MYMKFKDIPQIIPKIGYLNISFENLFLIIKKNKLYIIKYINKILNNKIKFK